MGEAHAQAAGGGPVAAFKNKSSKIDLLKIDLLKIGPVVGAVSAQRRLDPRAAVLRVRRPGPIYSYRLNSYGLNSYAAAVLRVRRPGCELLR